MKEANFIKDKKESKLRLRKHLERNKSNETITLFPLSRVFNEVVYKANIRLKSNQKINYPLNIDNYTLLFNEKLLEAALAKLIAIALKSSGDTAVIDLIVNDKNNTLKIKIISQSISTNRIAQNAIIMGYFNGLQTISNQGYSIDITELKNQIQKTGGLITCDNYKNEKNIFTIKIPLIRE